MLLRGTRRPAYAVAAGTPAQQQHDVARHRTLPADVIRLYRAHDRTHLQALGHVIGMVYLPYMRGSQPYLITVARIAGRSLGTDDTLRKFAFERLPHRLVYVARTRHTHRLVDIRPARKRVADGAAQAGGGTAERLYFGRMVVRFVLELKQPLLRLSVHIDVDENAAGVVFLTLLLVVEQSFLLQVTGADGRHVHQADRLAGTPQLFTHAAVEGQRLLHLALHERLVHGNLLQHGRKGGMAAMVAPIGIQYPEASVSEGSRPSRRK